MTKDENGFDAVRMMRTIRSELDEQMRGMTFDEEQAYIQRRLQSPSTDPDADRASSRPATRG
ncbi:MAG: hypothetical protein OXG35_25290 [Acidobacteria bacterium]|nr:hypothetical protein [Acidobacteriota bacterium]